MATVLATTTGCQYTTESAVLLLMNSRISNTVLPIFSFATRLSKLRTGLIKAFIEASVGVKIFQIEIYQICISCTTHSWTDKALGTDFWTNESNFIA